MRKEICTEIITDPTDTKREIDYLKQICANKFDNIKMDISFVKYNLAKLIYEKQKLSATIKNIHLVIFKSPQKVKIDNFMVEKSEKYDLNQHIKVSITINEACQYHESPDIMRKIIHLYDVLHQNS